MLTYALIGLGGAIGSILRAWLGGVMAAATVGAFPWGTILINVLGSFVIGFFGMLTATDGRFTVAAEMRAFVMVGLCGGFTTFSSFSLQTLDLLRDGRPGQALGNVGLSVALCLGSVAVGTSAALMLRSSNVAAGTVLGVSGDRTLIALHRPEAVPSMLALASKLRALETGGRSTALAINGPVLADLQPTEELLTRQRRAELSTRRNDWIASMRSTLDRWVDDERARGHRARWIEVGGAGSLSIAEHGRAASLLLLEHDPSDQSARARVHAALAWARRPVLLVPHHSDGDLGRNIAVAWRDDEEARETVRAAMPLLSKAQRVSVIHVGAGRSGAHVPSIFDGLPASLVIVPDEGDIGAQIVSTARDADADLLVMGSYRSGRERERLLGGVTESVLRQADLPVLLQPRTRIAHQV